METIYINNDERLGDNYEFTMSEMIEIYRKNNWDEINDEDGFFERKMSDDEIVSDVLDHDIEVLDK